MAFRELLDGRKDLYPLGTSDRYKLLDALERLRDGKLYEHLDHPFTTERLGSEYVPMLTRRPDVIVKFAKLVTNQTAVLTFGDEHAPTVRCTRDAKETENPFEKQEQAAEKIIDRLDLEALMMGSVFEGSTGGCALIVRSVGKKKTTYIEIVPAKNCRPVYDVMDPTDLIGLVQLYPTKGQLLLDVGYTIAELLDPGQKESDFKPDGDFWMRIEIAKRVENRFKPMTAYRYSRIGQPDPQNPDKKIAWVLDDKRSRPHGFGDVVPVIYIRQGKHTGIDGECFFADVADLLISIDYDLSQIGRALRYSADPLLAINRGELAQQNITGPIGEGAVTGPDGGVAKTASNVIPLEPGAKAQLLEISGQGLAVMGEFVKQKREYALEVMSGMKSEASSEKGVQSGRAMDALWEALKLLIKRLRIPYGNQGLIPLLRLLMTGIKLGILVIEDVAVEDVDPDAPYRLIWPQTQLPTGADFLAEATGVTLLAGASRSAGVRVLGDDLLTRFMAQRMGVTDPTAAIKEREADEATDATEAEALADADADRQTKIKAAGPAPVGPPK